MGSSNHYEYNEDIENRSLLTPSAIYPQENQEVSSNDRTLDLPAQLMSVKFSKDATNFLACKLCNALMMFTFNPTVVAITCWACNNCTPFRNNSVGKMFVRCKCFCLLLCKIGTPEIQCIACGDEIAVDWSYIKCNNDPLKCTANCECYLLELYSKDVLTVPGIPRLMRTTCPKCDVQFWFTWKSFDVPLAMCPNCLREHPLELKTEKLYAVLYLLIACILLFVGQVTLTEFLKHDNLHKFAYIPFACAFITSMMLTGCCVKKMFFTNSIEVINPDLFD